MQASESFLYGNRFIAARKVAGVPSIAGGLSSCLPGNASQGKLADAGRWKPYLCGPGVEQTVTDGSQIVPVQAVITALPAATPYTTPEFDGRW